MFLLLAGAFVLIYEARYKIYNWVQYIRVGPIYEDPTTWPKGSYGFREDAKKSVEIYQDGLEKLIEKAVEVYSTDSKGKPLVSNVSPYVSWQNHLNPKFLEFVLSLMRDVGSFCKDIPTEGNKYQKWDQNASLNPRKKAGSEGVEELPVNADNAHVLREWLSSLDRDHFFISMQKKPDHYSVISLREYIFQASCKPLHVIGLWYKPIDYLEYKAEQEAYTPGIGRDVLERKAKQNLKNNEHYTKFLRQFFRRSFPSVGSTDTRIKLSWKNFLVHETMESLDKYLNAMLDRCRVSGVQDCRFIYRSLYKLKFKGVSSNPVYLYTLAEVAFRGKEYALSKSLLNELFILKRVDPSLLKQAERLMDALPVAD